MHCDDNVNDDAEDNRKKLFDRDAEVELTKSLRVSMGVDLFSFSPKFRDFLFFAILSEKCSKEH